MNAILTNTLGLIASSRSSRIGIGATRIAIAIVFIWIGLLKFVPYEADSITPFVANSPVMSFFYAHPEEYKQHLTKEGELKPEERAWQTENHTYQFSDGLGTVELIIAALTLSGFFSKWGGLAGAALSFATPIVTLSFLITTPEAWVPALGDAQHGFPYLSGAGRLVLKDTVIMAGAWLIIVDTARAILKDRVVAKTPIADFVLSDDIVTRLHK
ncbi:MULTISPECIES: reactive chlorine resistance membrane protein RclC [unclassified Rhizobium]|uniref:reactive chlorine resistance membrane protein RclC n=1 Tax=unclassified Rhizobium TaxID=2613769 RepID=UPI0024685B86|nr:MULTISPECIES: reactive chlorine resistance membrane protein RclC [unclassified Rhizobium]